MKNLRIPIVAITCLLILLASCGPKQNPNADKEEWISMFNGKDLEGWTPKVKGYTYGENFNNTFKVTNGNLRVSYKEYDSFDSKFAHLFYKTKFSHYRLKAQYRMVGEQVKGGPGWAFANNGFMLHCQDPKTMSLDQDFPMSMEFQLLAGKGDGERPTGNLCTPGCHVHIDGKLVETHCIPDTKGATYPREKWVNIEAVVLGDSIVHQIVEGDTVRTFTKPIIGGHLAGLNKELFKDGTPMTEGYISIQGESHDTEFKNIEILDLCGCKDEKATNYKSYYTKHNQENCEYD
ncbi:DUF1080 domain-containing protein [Maribacter sp. HTCC2170]|uniref:3-keto-disaccharide hydrolase n=1 Tax=Maribacter sp. (strain HTCC2170 / KCCM 42371) TaxID=313603 RepID=UPI00006B494E|nr:DUF1080 domain-containing protein [Maribacter sp. HTCC2170]EAR00975.1 hypothetical protein FB2170_09396 [Maribacter sp. HTCC2170]